MAKIDVPMPQMGESIAEGTVSKWLKKVGDSVGRDEPLRLGVLMIALNERLPTPTCCSRPRASRGPGQGHAIPGAHQAPTP